VNKIKTKTVMAALCLSISKYLDASYTFKLYIILLKSREV